MDPHPAAGWDGGPERHNDILLADSNIHMQLNVSMTDLPYNHQIQSTLDCIQL